MRLFMPFLLAAALAAGEAAPAAPPPEAAIAAQQQAVRDLYKAELAAKDPAKRLEAVRRMLGLAGDGAPAERIAILREAALAAAKAGDVDLVRQALTGLEAWQLDASAEALAAYQALNVATVEAAQAPATDLLAAADAAIDRDQYPAAQKLADAAAGLARKAKDEALAKRSKAAQDEAKELGGEFAKLPTGDALGELTPAMQSARGRFYGLSKGDWEKALPLLVAGDDAPLKAAATLDVSAQDTAAREAAGEQWAQLARKAPARQRAALNRRALDCLMQAADGSSGLARARLDKRIAELEPLAGKPRAGAAPSGVLLWLDGEPGPDGKSVVDAGPNRLALSAGGKVQLLREGHGGFLRFDGTAGLTAVLKTPLPPTTSYTLACWLRGSATQERGPFLGIGGDDLVWHGKGWVLGMPSLAGEAKWFPQSKVGAMPGGTWHHLAFVLDAVGKEGTFYVDGAVSSTSPRPAAAPASAYDKLRLGTGKYGGFIGDLDQAGIWSRALTAEEIKALYDAGKNGR